MSLFCCDEERRALLRERKEALESGAVVGEDLNGIDRLHVFHRPRHADNQRVLSVFFVNEVADPLRATLAALAPEQVRILGGELVRGIRTTSVAWKAAAKHLEVRVDRAGDHSAYQLFLSAGKNDDDPPLAGLDPRLARVEFRFKVECASDLDCDQGSVRPPTEREEPELDYLAKDYASFRRLLFERLARTSPRWKERNPADLGVALVELMAYVGDHLSYRQDAVATEAYLGTARRRVSVRRHARLLDYALHEGCNARAWVQVRLRPNAIACVLARTQHPDGGGSRTCFATRVGRGPLLAAEMAVRQAACDARAGEFFEPLHDAYLDYAHNELRFHTWSDEECSLVRGATRATLKRGGCALLPGQVLVFLEKLGPRSGEEADADPAKRHAVLLTRVTESEDPLTPAGELPELTEIEWGVEDALPFPLCLSSRKENGELVSDVSVALGNIVLVDHGFTRVASKQPVKDAERGLTPWEVPAASRALDPVDEGGSCGCGPDPAPPARSRFRPRLTRGPLTHREVPALEAPAADDFVYGLSGPAARALEQDPSKALPVVELDDGLGGTWRAQRDLLASSASGEEFVAEIEDDGHARLRFGDDRLGKQPSAGTRFTARYRVGNGTGGNVGAGAIQQIHAAALYDADRLAQGRLVPLESEHQIESVQNPMPARGGIDPEPLARAREFAPHAFRIARRCVTPEDYAARAAQHPEVQRAAATVRWTGSFPTLFLSVDRKGGRAVDADFERRLGAWLEPFRLAGHDLEIDAPRFVSVELVLFVCPAPGYRWSDVQAALLDAFSSRERPDGSRGFFHPDHFTFGQALEKACVYRAAHAVAGVEHVEVQVLRRQGSGERAVPDALTVGRLEILRLENDPDRPDHGLLTLERRPRR